MTGPNDEDAVRELRAALSDRMGTLTPPPGLYEGLRRRHRRQRAAYVAGTAVVAAAAVVAVPALTLVRDRPAPVAAASAPGATAEPGSCVGGTGVDAPGLRPQDPVPGALGADPATVTAVLRVGWGLLRKGTTGAPRPDPATAEVRLVDRAADGDIVGLVTTRDRRGGFSDLVVVTGPGPDRLRAERARANGYGTSAATVGTVVVARPEACGHPRVVILAPPGSTATTSRVTGVRPDATLRTEVRPVPVRPDGVAVFDQVTTPGVQLDVLAAGGSAPKAALQLGPNLAAVSCVPRSTGPGCTTLAQAVAAAPGDGDPAQALSALQGVPVFPVPASDLRVPWRGRIDGGTVTAALVTFPGGAGYVWGGVAIPGMTGTYSFYGLVPADRLDRSALVFRVQDEAGGAVGTVVFVPGTATVRATVGGAPRTLTARGGVLLSGGPVSGITVTAADGSTLPVVDVQGLEGLPR